MATGALDANGIWQYGEDDAYATHSQLLNKLAESTSTAMTAAGKSINAVSVTKTDAMSVSIAAGAAADITGLSITHTMKKSTNKLLLIAQIGVMADSANLNVGAIRFVAGTTPVGVGTTAGSRISVSAGGQNSPSASTSVTKSLSTTYLYAPASTSAVTYKVQVVNVNTGTQTHYINRGVTDTDSAAWSRSISSFTIIEIAG